MKALLLDQGLPRSTTSFLQQANITAQHAADVGLSRAADSEILAYAQQRDLIVVTLDADFHMLLAASGAASPSVNTVAASGKKRKAISSSH
jgi:predicted nuclease of predicted toxin-antitoxin system